ncbi:MAG: PIG-L family deacetylase [Armatimonadetes bacterium]|nr:PIG-L family deacetylase [Armatimonadota bacterium]
MVNLRGLICRIISMFIAIISAAVLASQFVQCHRFVEKANASNAHEMNLSELGDRVLIISPHPDDEVLACGGLIALLSRNNALVKVLFVTLGEGFTFALEQELRTVFVSTQDRLRFAKVRASEASKALSILGDTTRNIEVEFLGIPETAMGQMWLRHWGEDNPCVKNALKSCYSHPFTNGIKPFALCADKVIDQLKRSISEFNPTSIFIPHRHDDHIVHWATNVFSLAALMELRYEGKLDGRVGVYEYLVHFGRYPEPQGNFPKLPLLPPKMLSEGAFEGWIMLSLPKDIVTLKAKAIKAYESQRSIMPRFMNSFVRSTEVFEKADTSEHLENGILIHDRLFEPVMPAIRPSADVKSILVFCSGESLTVTVNLRSKASELIAYRLHMFKPACSGNARYHLVVSVRGNGEFHEVVGISQEVVLCQRVSESLVISFPKQVLGGFATWLVTFEVITGGRMVDRTAPIIISIEGKRCASHNEAALSMSCSKESL